MNTQDLNQSVDAAFPDSRATTAAAQPRPIDPRIAAVERIAAELAALFPGYNPYLVVYPDDTHELSLHSNRGPLKYEEATHLLQDLGVGDRDKRVMDTYTSLQGRALGSKVKVLMYPDELPPTCRKVKYIDRVPKTKTVDTGEFIEVEREKIVCGSGPLAEKGAA